MDSPRIVRSMQLQFYLHHDAPKEWQDKWVKFHNNLIDQNSNHEIMIRWQTHMKLQSTKELPLLNRCEGGLGGDNNITCKQIRPDDFLQRCPRINVWGPIIIDPLPSADGNEKWSMEELMDLKDAMVYTIDHYTGTECCSGMISIQ